MRDYWEIMLKLVLFGLAVGVAFQTLRLTAKINNLLETRNACDICITTSNKEFKNAILEGVE